MQGGADAGLAREERRWMDVMDAGEDVMMVDVLQVSCRWQRGED